MSQKKLSLQEQLLKSGLASDAKAKQIRSEKHKQVKQQRNSAEQALDEAKALAQQAKIEQQLRDKELNLQNKAAAEKKALVAQIRQLIELNRQTQDANGIAYHFNDHNKVKTLYISEEMRNSISHGLLAIVKLDEHYEVVTAEIAQRIKTRDANTVLVFNEPNGAQSAEDDAYAAYIIPDDLMW